ncbi:MAG TPA: GAF domain-containing protein [Syntrophorhabdaceae bacterium]|nr:GAF domain-containing protein [Syntrophorhabdaceae bacterium]
MENEVEKRDVSGFKDILEIAHLLSSSIEPDKIIEAVLNSLCDRLGKRARCAFLEGEDLTLRFWAGKHSCPIGGIRIHKDSIVWDAVKKGEPLNITDPDQLKGHTHTLGENINIKAIIPLGYIDPLSNQRKTVGALIVDAGSEGPQISREEFEYLQVIGHLIGAIIGRAHLIRQLMMSCQWQEKILLETAHNFRNRIVVIGGISRKIVKSLKDTELVDKAKQLLSEVEGLEKHLAIFERYTSETRK